MDAQPPDEHNDVQNKDEPDINWAISQPSKITVPTPITGINYGSITDIVDILTCNTGNQNHSNNNGSSEAGSEEKIDELMEKVESGFGNMSADERIDYLTKELDMLELQHLNRSITERTMVVETQPPTDIRRRYESDGKRQIEKSRSKPMAIKLPNLKTCQLKSDQSFWLQLYLLTIDQNPSRKTLIHPYKLEYHDDNLPVCDSGFIRVPLTPDDIRKGIKQLARLSIIKIKLEAYTFKFNVYDPLASEETTETYENDKEKTVVAKAKRCRDLYHLQLSHIACRLVIKQNHTWLMTDIECKTDIMKEKEQQNDEKESSKRTASSSLDNNEHQIHSNPVKKAKTSSSSNNGLPVIYARNS